MLIDELHYRSLTERRVGSSMTCSGDRQLDLAAMVFDMHGGLFASLSILFSCGNDAVASCSSWLSVSHYLFHRS
ncbi:hypothetical protein J2X76_006350 [Neorhizobium sp. 2083]|uniref:hypothetical protein n=1 Tax=Neorhizobium sp. 2083 TaxID=2817762 RepID=UPI00285D0422|nr:hypothetical protein [Neorhizobium sp. 2083]MDR6821144.1 hypothetical protein [Neorhizobium sp. 2083]